MRLLLLTPAELTRDPRARRAASAALASGLDVVGLCGRISGEEPAELDGVPVRRAGRRRTVDPSREPGVAPRRQAPVRELRGAYRLGRLAVRTAGLVRAARGLGRFDVVHANDLDTLPAAWLLARRVGARLVYDAHELYSEFDQDPPRVARRVLLALERALARRADAVVTVSDGLADELVSRLRLRTRPLVVLNAPEIDRREPPVVEGGPLRVVYQGSLGPGRPLEDLLAAVEEAGDIRLTLRALRLSRPVDDERVVVEQPLPPSRVVDGLHGHEVGVVFDRPLTRNVELSFPNKVFEYLMAGLAVVVPDLPTLGRFVEGEGVGITFPAGRPELLGRRLQELASDRPRLAKLRARARAVAVERLNAEAQTDALLTAWGR